MTAQRNSGPFFSIPSLIAYLVICGTITLNEAHKIPIKPPISRLRRCTLSMARSNFHPSLRCSCSNSSRVATSESVSIVDIWDYSALGERLSTAFQ